MITLPARAQRAFTCRALAALTCIGALAFELLLCPAAG